MAKTIIQKMKEANLTGRGGAAFPTATKWEMVKKAKGLKKFVVCNASEGEPGIKKDEYIFMHHADKLIDGMKLAMKYLDANRGYVYINPLYYKRFNLKLRKLIGDYPIEIFSKPHSAGYVGGTETTALNVIEGKRTEPRLRPPYPTTKGLWGFPTLVNNVETFYDVSLIDAGEYKNKRFYTINGDCLWHGVYEYSEEWTIEQILQETKNYPDFPFFVQIGGDASGEVLDESQLDRPVTGAGSITIFSKGKHKPMDVMRNWISFFAQESCGQCSPCREGTYRLREILGHDKPDWNLVNDILATLSDTAICGLGCAVPVPFRTYIQNVIVPMIDMNDSLVKNIDKSICDINL